MAQYTDPTQLDGMFKKVYGDDIVKAMPDVAKFTKMVKFGEAEKIGDSYNFPVSLTREAGFTYAAADAGAFTLNNHIAQVMKNATLKGSQVTLRSGLGYDVAARSVGSERAFKDGAGQVAENMMESMGHRAEVGMWYGQSGLGITSSSANASSTSTVVTLTTASWASGIWAGCENAQIVFYNGSTLVSSGADAIFVITSVDTANRALTVTGTSTGITALDSGIGSGARTIYWYSAVTGALSFAEHAGVDKIVTNTGSLFGIDGAVYKLWTGSSYSAGSAALSLGKIMAATAKAVDKGLAEDVTCFVNPKAWFNLSADQASLRRFDGKEEEAENGFRALTFLGQNGLIKVMGHNVIKEGEAFILPLKQFKRVGATDVTFQTPGGGSVGQGQMFLHLANNAGYELRSYLDQALICKKPALCVKITSIVNN